MRAEVVDPVGLKANWSENASSVVHILQIYCQHWCWHSLSAVVWPLNPFVWRIGTCVVLISTLHSADRQWWWCETVCVTVCVLAGYNAWSSVCIRCYSGHPRADRCIVHSWKSSLARQVADDTAHAATSAGVGGRARRDKYGLTHSFMTLTASAVTMWDFSRTIDFDSTLNKKITISIQFF